MERSLDLRPSPPALTVDTVPAWRLARREGERRLGARCARGEARQRVGASRRGVLRAVERTHGWPLAAVKGAATPYGVQHLVGRTQGRTEAVREDWRGEMRRLCWPLVDVFRWTLLLIFLGDLET